jgi:ribosomal protein S10
VLGGATAIITMVPWGRNDAISGHSVSDASSHRLGSPSPSSLRAPRLQLSSPPSSNARARRAPGPRPARAGAAARLDQVEDVTKDIIFSAKHIGVDVGGVARLPTRRTRWWLPRSPFVHRKAIDQFERLEHNRVLVFYGSEQIGADSTKIVHFLRFMEQTIIPAHAGARAKITLYTEETVDAVPAARAEPRSAITEAVIEEEPPAAATRSDGGG